MSVLAARRWLVSHGRPILIALISAAAYGSWAAFAHRHHGPEVALHAGMTQAILSFIATLVLVSVLERLYRRSANPVVGSVFAPFVTSAVLVAWLAVGHILMGTPHVVAAMAPSVLIGSVLFFIYARGLLVQDRKAQTAQEAAVPDIAADTESRRPPSISRSAVSDHRSPRPTGIGLIGRYSTPLVAVLVVTVGAFTVLRLHGTLGFRENLSGSSDTDAIVSFNPKRILYEILGPPGNVATINYLDAEAQPHQLDGVALPWSFTLVTTLTSVVANVVAQSDSESLGCRITVNGVTRDERFVEAHHALTTCLVKSA